MAELADAHGSGPCESNFIGVQVSSGAPPRRSKVRLRFVFAKSAKTFTCAPLLLLFPKKLMAFRGPRFGFCEQSPLALRFRKNRENVRTLPCSSSSPKSLRLFGDPGLGFVSKVRLRFVFAKSVKTSAHFLAPPLPQKAYRFSGTPVWVKNSTHSVEFLRPPLHIR